MCMFTGTDVDIDIKIEIVRWIMAQSHIIIIIPSH